MRLGGPVFVDHLTPDNWVEALLHKGYRAAVFPVNSDAKTKVIDSYVKAAQDHDIIIAEVGAWSNPISPDSKTNKEAIAYCAKQLALADKVGARCCVNIAGSRAEQWDGPHPDNFSEDTFALIVDTVREIIDLVKPKRTFYALEMMPWVFPDTTQSYLDLIEAIDRHAFGVHFDPVNMISSPGAFYRNGEMIKEFVAKLGPHIKNCHAKDISLKNTLTVHLEEVVPGTGSLDYRAFIQELHKLDDDVPLIMEHLETEDQYDQAASYIRGIASELKIVI